MKDVFTVSSSALPEDTRVAGFRGTEAISRPYQIDLFLLVPEKDEELDIADAIGAKATLSMSRDEAAKPYVIHGIFAAVELLHTFEGRSLFRAVLVPQLWQLTQTLHSRIYTKMSIPDIIKAVLKDGGLGGNDYAFKLAGNYKPEEHVCQYGESHLDFIQRWMEREGMYYYFEQGDHGEKLVICDDKSFATELPPKPVRYWALLGHDKSSSDALHTFRCQHRALPEQVKLKDYDYAKPTLDVSGSAPVSKTGLGEISVYGARFFSPDDGKRLAKIRAEEMLAREVVFQGAGTCFYLRPGYSFKLEDHPRASFDAKYLVTAVTHYANQTATSKEICELAGLDSDEVYRVEMTAIPAAVQFRAESRTTWPRIYGFENGTVCGPANSEYAQIDDHGRYNVKFKFDESDLKEGKASTWVRMMQPHGGNPEGFHFPLRKHTEVIVSFLGGDPDRPVISGVVPDAHNPSPVTKSNHYTNVINTGANNRLEMDDKGPWAELSCPEKTSFLFLGATGHRDHNFVLSTQGTGLIFTHDKHDRFVDNEMHEVVKLGVLQEFKNTVTQTYGKHHEIKVESGGRKEEVKGGYDQEVKGGYKQKIEGGVGYDQGIKPMWKTKVEGPWEFEAEKVKWKIGGEVKIKCDSWEVEQEGEVLWKNFGEITHLHLTNKKETTMGMTTGIHIGIKNEILVGGKNELTVASARALFVGAKAEITLGMKADITAAVQFECNAGPKIEAKTAKVRKAEAEAEHKEAEMKKAVASIMELQAAICRHGIFVNCSDATFFP